MTGFKDKVVLVTGAGSGIGAACVQRFAAEGARVVAADRNVESAQEVANALGRAVRPVEVDVSAPGSVEALVADVLAVEGALDVAVNNAGVMTDPRLLHEISLADYRRVVETNLSGVFYGLKYEIPAMLGRGGVIINTASSVATVGFRLGAVYTATKHAVVGLTQTAALEYADQGLRVVAVAPGYIDTPMTQRASPETIERFIQAHPAGRAGRSEEVAALVCFLASSEASFITGSLHPVDGGYVAQ
ncbi:SDR family NAD(P)-dependent oxidoreductase [Streptomyces sp. NPDC086783]|uniref:SDR family NAD(P)-dependent oxidoreductase n=1 Tax=Streptomyces sp. NPDC086783 TaxID=3365758 RepID=UPI0037F9607C